jgi:alpha-N-acetylglucosaminidase
VADLLILRVVDSNGADREAADELLALFGALDDLLACSPEFRFSTWEADAASAAHTTEQRTAFVTAARQILTIWNPVPSTFLDDYAGRIWHGLVGDYYRRRWSAWLDLAAAGFPATGWPALEAELDRLSAEVIDLGVGDSPRSPTELAPLSRAAHDRFARTFVAGYAS